MSLISTRWWWEKWRVPVVGVFLTGTRPPRVPACGTSSISPTSSSPSINLRRPSWTPSQPQASSLTHHHFHWTSVKHWSHLRTRSINCQWQSKHIFAPLQQIFPTVDELKLYFVRSLYKITKDKPHLNLHTVTFAKEMYESGRFFLLNRAYRAPFGVSLLTEKKAGIKS